jgi:hypothetical protein
LRLAPFHMRADHMLNFNMPCPDCQIMQHSAVHQQLMTVPRLLGTHRTQGAPASQMHSMRCQSAAATFQTARSTNSAGASRRQERHLEHHLSAPAQHVIAKHKTAPCSAAAVSARRCSAPSNARQRPLLPCTLLSMQIAAGFGGVDTHNYR